MSNERKPTKQQQLRRPATGAPIEQIDAWLAQYSDVASWPDPTPEQIDELRRLFGYAR